MLSVNDTVRSDKATSKYKQTNTKFVERFNMGLAKQIFKTMYPQELQDLKQLSTISVINLENLATQPNYYWFVRSLKMLPSWKLLS